MESFLKGRKHSPRVKLPVPVKRSAVPEIGSADAVGVLDEEESRETIVEVAVPETLPDPPRIELVTSEGVVQRILIHCSNGQYIELECDYGEEDESV